ncbi:MAG TPA: hypothetical protein VGI63_08275 [Verrucomicrobiae bacterium]|jgi:hypothetical protein
MGRRKNAVKIEHWRGLTLIEKIRLATFGNRFFDESADHNDPPGDYFERLDYWKTRKRDKKASNFSQAASLLDKIFAAIKLEKNSFESFSWPGVSNQQEYEIIKKCELKEAWAKFSEVFMRAVESRDATIFKDMAYILENQNNPIQPDRVAFGTVVLNCQMNRIPLPTPAQMVKAMEKSGLRLDHKKIERLEDYFEIKLPRKARKKRIGK